jgi:peroxiredoxin Q/BCP
VFGVSTDNVPSQREFGTKIGSTVPFLSDFAKRETATAYGVLNKDAGVANRATFVIDQDGKITYIEEGNTAIDPIGATDACSRSAHKAGQ